MLAKEKIDVLNIDTVIVKSMQEIEAEQSTDDIESNGLKSDSDDIDILDNKVATNLSKVEESEMTYADDDSNYGERNDES